MTKNQKTHRNDGNAPLWYERVTHQKMSPFAGKSFLWVLGIALGVFVGILLNHFDVNPLYLYFVGFGFSLSNVYHELTTEQIEEHPFIAIFVTIICCIFWLVLFVRGAAKVINKLYPPNS